MWLELNYLKCELKGWVCILKEMTQVIRPRTNHINIDALCIGTSNGVERFNPHPQEKLSNHRNYERALEKAALDNNELYNDGEGKVIPRKWLERYPYFEAHHFVIWKRAEWALCEYCSACKEIDIMSIDDLVVTYYEMTIKKHKGLFNRSLK